MLSVLLYLFPFPTTDFSMSLGRFLRNFATWRVRGEKTQFLPICRPKIDTLGSAIP